MLLFLTLGRIIRDLPAVLPYHVTSAVSSSGLSNFDLFEHLKKHLTGRRLQQTQKWWKLSPPC